MRCPRCCALNSDGDAVCVSCGRKLPEQVVTPQWAFIFATACGLIPIVALGGLIPIMLGASGAGGCMGVARFGRLPLALRFLACVGITGVCWLLFFLAFAAAVAEMKHSH